MPRQLLNRQQRLNLEFFLGTALRPDLDSWRQARRQDSLSFHRLYSSWKIGITGESLASPFLPPILSWGAFSLFTASLHQFQQFGNDVSPSNLSDQIPEFLVSARVFGLPVEPIQTVNGCKLGLQIVQSTHALVNFNFSAKREVSTRRLYGA